MPAFVFDMPVTGAERESTLKNFIVVCGVVRARADSYNFVVRDFRVTGAKLFSWFGIPAFILRGKRYMYYHYCNIYVNIHAGAMGVHVRLCKAFGQVSMVVEFASIASHQFRQQ